MSIDLVEQRHWKAPDRLLIRREKGWAYRFIKKLEVDYRISEGWEVCKSQEKVNPESGKVDSTQNYRGLILMRIPQHMADERNTHYLNQHKRRVRASGRGSAVSSKADDINRGTSKSDLTGAIGKGLTLKEGVITDEGLHHSNTTVISVNEKIEPEERAEDKKLLDGLREAQSKSDEEFAQTDEVVNLEENLSRGGKPSRKK